MNIEWRPELMGGVRTYVPSHIREGLCRYVEGGIRPGDGLRAILEDRPLSEILGRVDSDVETHLGSIYRFLYNAVGSPAWGSPEKVAAWIEQKGLHGG